MSLPPSDPQLDPPLGDDAATEPRATAEPQTATGPLAEPSARATPWSEGPDGSDLQARPAFMPRRSSAHLPAQPQQPVEPAGRERLRFVASAVGLALLAAAALIVGLGRQRSAAVVPQAESLLQAAGYVGAQARAGDALAFAPAWSSHQPAAFAQAWQAKGLDAKADFLTAEPLDLWQADGYQRLWVVATHDRLSQLQLPLKALQQRDFGQGTAVALYALPTSTTLLDVRKSLAKAAVQVGGPDQWQACSWNDGRARFACGGPSWQDVWAELQEVGNTRRDCVYLHPPHDRGAVRVTVPSLGAARVVGHVGNRLWAVRHGQEGAPVRFRLLVGGEPRSEITLATADFRWHPFSAELGAADLGKPVTFEAYSDKEAWRELCFEARLQAQAAKGSQP